MIKPGTRHNKKNISLPVDKIKSLGSQAIWFIPIVGSIKNLIECLQGSDTLTERTFKTKEKIAKSISSIASVTFRIVTGYGFMREKDIQHTLAGMGVLQGINRTSYGLGIYFSGELQELLKSYRDNISRHTKKIGKHTHHIRKNTNNNLKKTFVKPSGKENSSQEESDTI